MYCPSFPEAPTMQIFLTCASLLVADERRRLCVSSGIRRCVRTEVSNRQGGQAEGYCPPRSGPSALRIRGSGLSCRLLSIGTRRLIMARFHASGDRQAIPRVNRRDGERQIREFLLGEMCSHQVVDRVCDVAARDQGHGFSPLERRPLTV